MHPKRFSTFHLRLSISFLSCAAVVMLHTTGPWPAVLAISARGLTSSILILLQALSFISTIRAKIRGMSTSESIRKLGPLRVVLISEERPSHAWK